jgi:hypothetical protein
MRNCRWQPIVIACLELSSLIPIGLGLGMVSLAFIHGKFRRLGDDPVRVKRTIERLSDSGR